MAATYPGYLPPPPGVTPNLDNPEIRADYLHPISYLGIALSSIFLFIRIYTKAFVNRSFGAEDVCIVLSWICVMALTILMLILRDDYSLGVHGWNVPPEIETINQKVGGAGVVIFIPGLALAKISILLIFYRLAPSGKKIYRYFVIGCIAFVGAFAIALVFAQIFPCNPVEKGWDASIEGQCVNRAAIYIDIAAIGIVTDLVLILLPIPIVRHLQIPRMQKVGLGLIFGVGSITLVTSIIRLITIIPLKDSTDPTWDLAPPVLWVVIEAHLLVICPCCISMKSFLRRHAPYVIGEKSRSKGDSGKSSFGHTADTSHLTNGTIQRDITFDVRYPDPVHVDDDEKDGKRGSHEGSSDEFEHRIPEWGIGYNTTNASVV